MDEEALRSHFLVQLNGHLEGQATGETFNYHGKTDILIRSGANLYTDELKSYEGWANTSTKLSTMQRSTCAGTFTRTAWRTSGRC